MNEVKKSREQNLSEARAAREAKQANQEAQRMFNVASRAKRTPQEQLEVIDHRNGKGVGAVSERRRLKKQIADMQVSG